MEGEMIAREITVFLQLGKISFGGKKQMPKNTDLRCMRV
jgi:hypothetical protein